MTVAVPPTDPYVIFTDTDPDVLRLYRMMPEFLRRADEEDTTCTGGYPFLRWLDIQFRWYGGITELMDRFNFPTVNTTTSDLVDPFTSNDEWLEWLAQLVNISFSATPGATTTSSWAFLAKFVDAIANGGDGNGVPTWTEWQYNNRTWQQMMDANLADRSQLFPVRDAIQRRTTLSSDPYTTSRSAYGYYDGSGPAIAHAIKAVLGGTQYVWVGSRAKLLTLGPVLPGYVTLAGSLTEYFQFSKTISLAGQSNIITLKTDHTPSATANTVLSYGDVVVSSTSAGITIYVGTASISYNASLVGRAAIEVNVNFTTPGTALVTLKRTPNGGSVTTHLNAQPVVHTITPPDNDVLLTFGRGFTGVVYSATFDTSACTLTGFAVANQFLNTGSGSASTGEVYLNTGGDTMTFSYTGTPWSGTTTTAPEWARIHVVTRASETPSGSVVPDAAETQRPAGFTLVYHLTSAPTEGP